MERAIPTLAFADDAAAVTEVVGARESSLYGESAYSQADLEDEWSELDLEQDARVVRAGDQIAAGTICRGDAYGGGWVDTLFTRRPWRKQGLGAGLLGDSFGRFWERGEHSVGLIVDAASDTGAFRLYERAGMAPALGWALYEKGLGDAA
jgi:GNAT superfamily N-acetyltransferase